jgi:hypothetical protein
MWPLDFPINDFLATLYNVACVIIGITVFGYAIHLDTKLKLDHTFLRKYKLKQILDSLNIEDLEQ